MMVSTSLIHRGGAWLVAAIVLAIASLVINAVLHLLRIGNLKSLIFINQLRGVLDKMPRDLVLDCDHRTVSAYSFDASAGREVQTELWTGGLMWSGGPKSANQILARAKRQVALRATMFAAVFVPLFGASLALAVFADWKLLLLPAVLLFHQYEPFYIFDYPGLSGLTEG